MAGQGVRTTTGPSDVRKCRIRLLQWHRRQCAPAVSDRLARAQYLRPPAARQRPRPDAEIDGAAGSWRLAPRQAHGEHRTFARLARHRDVAAHHARELAGDGEAETGAAETLRGRDIGLSELLEQLGLLFGGHADAGVGDCELDPVPTVSDPARPQPDLAFLGELAGIAQQVEQYLPQPHGVHGQCTEVLLGVDDEAVLVLLGQLASRADHLLDQWCQLHGLWVEFELTGFDLREVEYLVDEAKKVSTSSVHALQWLLRLFRAEARGVFDHHLGQADDGVEWRAQLVAHAGDELRLVLARQFELAVLVLDFVEQPHVLYGDNRLTCEIGHQLDLTVGERTH